MPQNAHPAVTVAYLHLKNRKTRCADQMESSYQFEGLRREQLEDRMQFTLLHLPQIVRTKCQGNATCVGFPNRSEETDPGCCQMPEFDGPGVRKPLPPRPAENRKLIWKLFYVTSLRYPLQLMTVLEHFLSPTRASGWTVLLVR
jgi:hypothetical protein